MVDLGPYPRSGDLTGGATTSTECTAQARGRIRRAYRREVARAGGSWHALVTLADPDGTHRVAVEDAADEVVPAASVNKAAIACAVLDKVDRGALRLDRTLELTADTVLYGDGIYHLQTVWGDRLTLANVLTAMLMLSDNTAVRLCGQVCAGPEINEYLAGKGFTHTRVEPLPDDPRRMFLGTTTARETHRLLHKLVDGSMVSPAATRFVLSLLHGFTDGVRREMSSAERLRTVSKYGALDDGRHEAGAMFDADRTPRLIFSFFADLPGHGHNHGATHPLVAAHARLGRRMRDEVGALWPTASTVEAANPDHVRPPTVGPAHRP
ncbi:serine hydrolase [Planosporangium thailandense]|uniref:serine hydrolase n=1 Tax=Planosporangium thailandense TaxID=765197 RepID=UPI001F0DD663|nr:serine hydrolase [Planosporangium thailandense]